MAIGEDAGCATKSAFRVGDIPDRAFISMSMAGTKRGFVERSNPNRQVYSYVTSKQY